METVENKDLDRIGEYGLETTGVVMDATITPGTEQISQALGELLANHAYTRCDVPSYLVGCIDAIFAAGLARLRYVATNSADCDPDLRRVITQALDMTREQMRERVNKQDVTA